MPNMSNKSGRSDLRISMREEETRPQTHWSPPAVLDAPQARPGNLVCKRLFSSM